jgi:hypothetical protein
VIFQFARGARPSNPTAHANHRAGNLAARTTLFATTWLSPCRTSKNPTFLTHRRSRARSRSGSEPDRDLLRVDGATTIDPDGAAPYFETPSSLLPEDLTRSSVGKPAG